MSKHRGRREGATSEEEARATGHRHVRLQQIIQKEITSLVRDELVDPALNDVVITSCELSVDYKNARIRFMLAKKEGERPRQEREAAERAFTRATPFLRARLAEGIDVKVVPNLRFVWDQDAADAPDFSDPL